MAKVTNFRVKYKLDTIDASTDVDTLTAVGQRNSISDIYGLYTERYDEPKFITTEKNFTVLDGTYSTEDFTKTGFVSNAKGTSDGSFNPHPAITFDFVHRHKSYAITLYCIEDSPVEAILTWWSVSDDPNADPVKLDSITAILDPNKRINTIIHPVIGYNRFKIEFVRSLPDRYININRIEFGTTMHWDESVIKDGTLVKGLSRDGSRLSNDTLTFSIVDNSYDINLANPNGVHTMFQRDQAIVAYEDLDNETLQLGNYFLDSFTAEGNKATIVAVSYIGVLDRYKFIASGMYNATPASTVIAEIFTAAGISSDKYDIHEDIASIPLTGTITPCTCKEAIQKVMFACHATIDSTNPNNIKISPYSTIISTLIYRENKTKTKVSEIEAVSQVRLTYRTYIQSSEETEVFTDDYPAGSTQTVYFDNPYYSVRIQTGASFVSRTTYSITFTVDSSQADTVSVTVMGYPYEIVERTMAKSTQTRIDTTNIIEFDTDLCTTSAAKTLLDKLAEYYGNSLRIEVQHYANDDTMNTIASIQNQTVGLDNYIGVFEERTFNLTGGFLDSCKLRGYYDTSDRNVYTGDDDAHGASSAYEIFTGDSIGIL